MQLPSLQASQLFGELRKKSIRSVERTGWLSRQTKSKLMQKLATTKVRSQTVVYVTTKRTSNPVQILRTLRH